MQVLLFGLVAEKAGTERIIVQATSMSELRCRLNERIPGLGALSYAIAVNRRIVHEEATLSGTEEIAVLPPFAGG